MTFTTNDITAFKQKAQQWANQFDVCCYMGSNNFSDPYSRFDLLIAAGVEHELSANAGMAFARLEQFRQQHPGWMTGFLGYDLKNEIEHLSSDNPDHLHFPDLYFFVPRHLITVKDHEATILSDDPNGIFYQIEKQELHQAAEPVALTPRFSKADYVGAVQQIQQHIIRGDVYVTNFCQEFYADNAEIDPMDVFERLDQLSPNPFACFFKHYQQYILCASPERFLAKRGSKLISQPIKGTAKRQHNAIQDQIIRQELHDSPKEQQENVMVVDLVRNDLTHSAKPGTVRVEELFGIYSFSQVHQMISTVVCELREGISDVQAIRNTFPMGSMTGAPKISSMRLMEQYERSKRGVYSGAIGYFDPDGDFDLNVVIRSLLYNADHKYLSLHVGGAITYDAIPEKEYEECLIKASAIFKVLGM